MNMGWYDFQPYISVGEKKEKAQKQLEKLCKKSKNNISPVIIKGRKIATTWWGIAWNKNLESYAQLANRIDRGSAYVKNGFVLDLQINEGEISALVYGSKLYEIKIRISKLSDNNWSKIQEKCSKRIDSIAALAEGNFPREFSEFFMKQGDGLFPSPKEIKMDCSCPDSSPGWMCKHVAAVLYGVGARLDTDPLLLFKLRGIDPSELIKKSVDEKMKSLMQSTKRKSDRIISDKDAARIFGV
ncbi:MAG: SWIM zinc finger family protein [Holosporaceae bacterium]|jgi:uncharacterized Zn finger protein|nr:SWIM zinc finger family protein [Holosporaceae bacterium]